MMSCTQHIVLIYGYMAIFIVAAVFVYSLVSLVDKELWWECKRKKTREEKLAWRIVIAAIFMAVPPIVWKAYETISNY